MTAYTGPRKLALRLRLALWAFRNPDRLTMLHFEMLRDADTHETRRATYDSGIHGAQERGYCDGRTDAADLYSYQLQDMPGAAENKAAL